MKKLELTAIIPGDKVRESGKLISKELLQILAFCCDRELVMVS